MEDSLYDTWARRYPNFEKKFEQSLLREYTDYGIGVSQYTEAKGKILGAGYELYIIAFFIGLYSNKKRELYYEKKSFGHPIQAWGNIANKGGRKAYPRLREYIYTALITRCDSLDLIALEKGDLTIKQATDMLIDLMEQYANFGFYVMLDKLEDDPNYFYKHTGFLDLILDIVKPNHIQDEVIENL